MVFKKGDKNINRAGRRPKVAVPKHPELWLEKNLPPGLADMRYIYYSGQAENRAETLGQAALRKMLADSPQKFVERMDELEKMYAEARAHSSSSHSGASGDGEAKLDCKVTEQVVRKIEEWLDKAKEKAEYLWRKGDEVPLVFACPEGSGSQQTIPT